MVVSRYCLWFCAVCFTRSSTFMYILIVGAFGSCAKCLPMQSGQDIWLVHGLSLFRFVCCCPHLYQVGTSLCCVPMFGSGCILFVWLCIE